MAFLYQLCLPAFSYTLVVQGQRKAGERVTLFVRGIEKEGEGEGRAA